MGINEWKKARNEGECNSETETSLYAPISELIARKGLSRKAESLVFAPKERNKETEMRKERPHG